MTIMILIKGPGGVIRAGRRETHLLSKIPVVPLEILTVTWPTHPPKNTPRFPKRPQGLLLMCRAAGFPHLGGLLRVRR